MSDHDPNHRDLELCRPELRRFIEAAREQPLVGTCVTLESVQAGLGEQRRRSHGRRLLALSGSIAVAASLVAVGLVWPLLSGGAGQRSGATAQGDAKIIDSGVAGRDAETLDAGAAARDPEIIDSGRQLASAVRLRSTSSVEVRDAWTIALGDGTHEIEVERGAERPLAIELPGRTLELVEGSASVEVAGDESAVRLHTGVAAWVSDTGERTRIQVQHVSLPNAKPDSNGEGEPSSAAALAREADRLLAAGDRGAAIDTLRRLIQSHPHASQTRAAVLDLARLLDNSAGRQKQARCAYELYLERWPETAVAAEVEARLQRLRRATCHGLDPQ